MSVVIQILCHIVTVHARVESSQEGLSRSDPDQKPELHQLGINVRVAFLTTCKLGVRARVGPRVKVRVAVGVSAGLLGPLIGPRPAAMSSPLAV